MITPFPCLLPPSDAPTSEVTVRPVWQPPASQGGVTLVAGTGDGGRRKRRRHRRFPSHICHAEDGRPSNGDVAGAGNRVNG